MAVYTLPGVTVNGPTQATQVSTTRILCHTAYLQAHPSNTDVIWIGDVNVGIGGPGIRIEKPAVGQALPGFAVSEVTTAPNAHNLADIYFISPSSGQKLNVVYVQG